MTDREPMDEHQPQDDPSRRRAWEQVQREWAESEELGRQMDLELARIEGRQQVLREMARREQALAARRRCWPF